MNILRRWWNRQVTATAQQLGITVPEMTIPDESVKIRYKWPDCAPPDNIDKSKEYWEQYLCCNFNGINYKMFEVEPGRWQWRVNEKLERMAREYEAHRANLYWALRSRVLTDEEMSEVERYGSSLNIQPMVSYSAHEKELELNNALLQQFRMRDIAAKK